MAQDLESATQADIDEYFKVLDVPFTGDQARQVAVKSVVKNNASVSLDPPNANEAIRVTFDDLPREHPPWEEKKITWLKTFLWRQTVGDYADELNLYPTCTNRFRTTYKPQLIYQNGTDIPGINYSRLYSRSTLRGTLGKQAQSDWFVMKVFAWHNCLSKIGRIEEMVVAFTTLQKGKCPEGMHISRLVCEYTNFCKSFATLVGRRTTPKPCERRVTTGLRF
jgi:hypothetical protein